MAICKHCNALIKPLGMPVDLIERMEVELRQIISDVNYRFSDKPHHPVPMVPLLVEWCHDLPTYMEWVENPKEGTWPPITTVVVWKQPLENVKIWTYHVAKGDTQQSCSAGAEHP